MEQKHEHKLFTHTLINHLLINYNVPQTVLDTRDTLINKTGKHLYLHGAYILTKEDKQHM